MGSSSGPNNFPALPSSSSPSPPKLLPPRPHPLLLPPSSSHDSQTESASSRDTDPDPLAVRRAPPSDRLSLVDLARDPLDSVAVRLAAAPDDLLDSLRSDLRALLDSSSASPRRRDHFLHLQRLVHSRRDLSPHSLASAHRTHLEALAALSTGIQAFLHPGVSLPPSHLAEVLLHRRCRNLACRSPLPADDCSCDVCSSRPGFCNLCMCVVCCKFDFDVNTCRWIGCDLCSHWTHTDCAIRDGRIGMGPSSKAAGGAAVAEMLFRCQACSRTSELLGWVRDVFQHCAPGWDREALTRELDFVSRIFRGSKDPRGVKLYMNCENLIEKMKSGFPESSACKLMLMLFQDLEMESPKNPDGDDAGRLIAPHEACNRIAKVVQEALRKMEMVAEEKARMTKRARQALDTCTREVDDKTRELAELKAERQRKKQQVEELESIVRLKQAEAEMFQRKASEARREADWLQSIALAKSKKAEQDYTSRYLEARLEEAEMEKQYLFEKIRLQETQRAPPPLRSSNSASGDPSQSLMLSKIQDVIKSSYTATTKSDGPQPNEHYHLSSNP